MLEATLCFLIEGDPPERILLGHKKVGFGKGKYGGVGGKIVDGETAVGAAVRELEEETGVRAREADLVRMAHLTFLFPYRPEWSQVVHVFVTRKWVGEAVESREIRPFWFWVRDIPFGETRTYGDVARRIGRPGAVRAVGNALHRNPFPLVVPCHRVLREGGGLGGYACGPAMKRRLLAVELGQTELDLGEEGA